MTCLEPRWWPSPPLHPTVKRKHGWALALFSRRKRTLAALKREGTGWGMLNLGGWSCLSHCPYPPDPCKKERRWQVVFFGDVVCPDLFIVCLTLIVVLWMPVEAGQASAGKVSAWSGGIYLFVLSPGRGEANSILYCSGNILTPL